MSGIEASDRQMIHDLVCGFFLAFDTRDWAMMTSVLAPEVYVDYASSGRELPAVMPAAEFVARRQRAVDTLMKHHSFSNLLLEAKANNVRARCNYTILRFAVEIPAKDEDFYHSCGTYEFVFSKTSDSWTIASITQKHLKSWGNRSLHGGTSPIKT